LLGERLPYAFRRHRAPDYIRRAVRGSLYLMLEPHVGVDVWEMRCHMVKALIDQFKQDPNDTIDGVMPPLLNVVGMQLFVDLDHEDVRGDRNFKDHMVACCGEVMDSLLEQGADPGVVNPHDGRASREHFYRLFNFNMTWTTFFDNILSREEYAHHNRPAIPTTYL
jgi:hypothetical protein